MNHRCGCMNEDYCERDPRECETNRKLREIEYKILQKNNEDLKNQFNMRYY